MKVKLTLVYCAFGMGDSFQGRYKFNKEIKFPGFPYDGLRYVVTLNGKDSVPFVLKEVTLNENGTAYAKLFCENQGKMRGFEKYEKEDAYCAGEGGLEQFRGSGWTVEEFPIKD